MLTTIQKWGNSQAIRLPKTLLDDMMLQENDKVEIVTDINSGSIIIKKAARKRYAKISLEERFKDYSGEYKCEECDWGPPVGNEVW